MADWSVILALDNGGVRAWFREQTAAGTPPDQRAAFLDALRQAGRAPLAEDIAALWEAGASAEGQEPECLAVWRLRAAWDGGDRAALARTGEKITALFRKDPLRRRMAEAAGFDRGLALDEAFRRLDLLLGLKAGGFVLDKTWGFGVIQALDDFYGKVIVDFDRKAGHEVTLAYAAEALQPLGDEHFFVRRHRDPQGMAALVQNEPAEVVKLALRSFGPLTAPRLQELLCSSVVPPAAWKTFWDTARKALRSDGCVIVPAKRTEPLQLLARERDYGDDWFAELGAEREAARIFERLAHLAATRKSAELTPAQRGVVGERLAYILHSRGDRDPALRARAAMTAAAWAVDDAQVNAAAERARLLEPTTLLEALDALSTRDGRALMAFLAEGNREALVERLAALLPVLASSPLNEALEFLIADSQQERVAACLRDLVARRAAGVEVLYWLARRPERMAEWNLGSMSELPFLIMAALEGSYAGDRLRTANQLEARLQDREWLQAMTAPMSPLQRASMIQYLRDAAGRTMVDTQSLITRLVLLYPELEAQFTATAPADARLRHNMTSWRRYRERQQQLHKLVTEEIPQNSRDIGQARSYGDLRENFEFKAAKEQQAILLHRQAEWEEGLRAVKGTDFRGFASDTAGMGTTVGLEYPDGTTEQYHILGEWDQDTTLGIISCSSGMGKALDGHGAGDTVTVPGADGERSARLAAVRPLPEAILAWARGD